MDKRKNRKAFWIALGISLFIFLTAAGLVAVDYQGRKMSFGDSRPPFQVKETPDGQARLQILLFGGDKTVDITSLNRFWNFLCDFGCIPHK